jgi:hypothetical protein
MREPTRRFFFAHLRDAGSLRKSSLSWMAVGDDAEFLPDALLVRAVQDRLSQLVDEICRRLLLVSKGARACRLRTIFDRHILGAEHWSLLASELYLSRRQFFRERKLLCDQLCSLLKAGLPSRPSVVLMQPLPEDLAFNEASLALQSGNLKFAERIAKSLCTSLPAGELRSRALTLAADCAIDGLRFDVASTLCALAAGDVEEVVDLEARVIASARVCVTRSRVAFMLSNYGRARTEMKTALRGLSELSAASNHGRSGLMQAVLVRQAEIALHTGDVNGALEHMQHLRYALGRNGESSVPAFDLASIESATEMFVGRLQCALAVLAEAFSSAQRLGFNRQIVRLAIERAWIEIMVDRKRGRVLAPQIAGLADVVPVPELQLEAALFCAMNESPSKALEFGSLARAMAPRDSMWGARAMLAQADSSFKLGRIADAWDLATEAEQLTGRLGNHRMRACALAPMARSRLKSGDTKAARILTSKAEELMRLYGAAPERTRLAELTSSK